MAHVLVVDDSPTELHVLKTILEKNGHQVSTAENGEEGIEVAKLLKPELILMDVVMPGLNGFQATRKLSKDDTTSGIPVIIVTTKDQETDKVWGMRQGAKEYVVKPVEEAELLEKIQQVMG
ncbi:two-component system response regulator [Solemya pervernicosa gill symbiont]|uniref:Two-component system response regulator n=2 Tax=Gammaproteobacteria incertae sedis TaxID=118884 RepID=A0A1T2L9Z9_9GAMM|nr:response regulator [Candidatus Reidiella endopervernicosa]OOZ41923.1 two-component system response regulator [Solemya pervernicosa gill symbiont]QKQ24889.1 response regulator [Candidatus Reidiella endopervernicosa]